MLAWPQRRETKPLPAIPEAGSEGERIIHPWMETTSSIGSFLRAKRMPTFGPTVALGSTWKNRHVLEVAWEDELDQDSLLRTVLMQCRHRGQ
jgi:hypothetical protein